MATIDDPIDAVKQYYPEASTSPVSVMLEVLGPLNTFVGIGNVFREFFSRAEANARVKALFEAIEWYVRKHDKRIDELELEKQLQNPEAKEAVMAAVTEAIFSADIKKIERFGAIVGHELISTDRSPDWEAAATYIRELAQLGEDDIRTLQTLHQFQSALFLGPSQKPDQPQFANTMERVLITLEKQGISREDVYSRCARLNGFGLTLQMERPRGTVAVDYVYRLTRSGKRLIDILQRSGS